MAWQGLRWTLICALSAVTVEIAQIERGGLNAVSWRLPLTLLAAYGLLAGVVFGTAQLLTRGSARGRWIALSLFLAAVLLPWVNFDYLPEFTSVRSLLGNAAVVVGALLLARLACGFPRLSTGLVLIAFSFVALQSGASSPRMSPSSTTLAHATRPNVLLVVIDTLRADHLSLYGYSRATSPMLTRLAQEGVIFDTAIAQAPWTKPSVASLLTGTHVHRHGVVWRPDVLGSQLSSLPETMQLAGYQTAAFSSNPWITPEFGFDQGFDYFFQSAKSSGIQLTILFRLLSRLENRLRALVHVSYDFSRWLRRWTETNPANWQRDALLADAFTEWLDEARDGPFFAYVHFIGPHTPYDPPQPYPRMFRDAAWNGKEPPTLPPTRARSIFATAEPLDDLDRNMLIGQYDAAIAYTDTLLERIVGAMDEIDLLKNTLLVITSDHGEEFYEHGNWQHGRQMYNEVVRVPLVFRFPTRLEHERRMDPAMLVDVFPTIASLAGVDVDPAVSTDGHDLFAESGDERPVFAECYRFEGARYMARMVLRDGRKLIQTRDDAFGAERFELYDLDRDAAEQHDLLDAASAPDGEPLTPLLTGFGGSVAEGARTRIQSDTEERLRALGY
jgi:arylsulfatase A-like enzyme